MSDSSTAPPTERKSRLALVLLAIGVVAFLIFAFSLGGLTWWLISRRPASTTPPELTPPATAARQAATGFAEIFNGRDLDGWDFDPEVWSVRDGVITGHQRRGGYGRALFWSGKDIADFELHFRFRLVRGNSGIYYRSAQLANFDVGGYEFEIYANKTGNLADNGTDRVKRRLHVAQDAEPIDSEWHEGVIVANGSRLIHRMDGKVLCDLEDTEPAAPRSGAIGLAITSSTIVEFKDLRLKQVSTR